MLHYTARAFFWCGRMLRTIRGDCFIGSVVSMGGGSPGFHMRQDLDSRASEKARKGLVAVEREFRRIGMLITADMAHDLAKELDGRGLKRSFEWLDSQIEILETIATKELKNRVFLYIPPERSSYWPTFDRPHLFGTKVGESFPSASFDIVCSGQCLALGMSTAAVFHLMRVMEIALTALGRVFGVTFDRTNWTPAIAEVEKKIRNMHEDPVWKARPDWREQRDFYSEAATGFSLIKDAWRNHAMHARAKYSDDEAERIFAALKAFTSKLAERLSE